MRVGYDPPGAADGFLAAPTGWWAADVEERISVEWRLDRLETSVRADPGARAGVEEQLAGIDWAY